MLVVCGGVEMPSIVFLSPDERRVSQNTWDGYFPLPDILVLERMHLNILKTEMWNEYTRLHTSAKAFEHTAIIGVSDSEIQSLGSSHPHAHLRVESGKWSKLIS